LGNVKKLVQKYKDQRITEKKFKKEFKKKSKILEVTLEKNKKYKEYELLTSMVTELPDLMDKNLSAAISGYRLAEFISKDLKKNNLPKKFTHDLSKLILVISIKTN